MAKLIGTAGHVDHGKTTLIKALTGIDADRLPEEKKRGMTIDIGFAYVDLPGIGRVSIVDVPGHERFITNMLVGAQGIDVAMLCVAADESVMPQTREHLQILELLPVQKLVVALTRSDLADDETRQIARAEVEELTAASRFGGSPIVEVSAFSGLGLDELKASLATAMSAPERVREGPWYLPIDRVFGIKGHGVVVTGTLAQGALRVGDRAVLEPGGLEARVRRIHSHDEELSTGEKGRRTALNLGGIKLEDVRRGMAVGELGALFETSMIDAKMTWIEEPRHASRIRVSMGAGEAIGKLFLSDSAPDIVQIRLETAIACALHQPLIVRRYSPPNLLGGGRVVTPVAKLRRRAESVSSVDSAPTDEAAVLGVLDGQIQGVPTDEVCRRLGKTEQAMGAVFESLKSQGAILGFAGLWFEKVAFDEATAKLLAAVAALHEANPAVGAIPRDRAASAAGLKWSGKPLDRIVSALAAQGRLEASGTQIRDSAFRIRLSDRQRELMDRVLGVMNSHGANPPGASDVATALHVPPQAVEEILRLGVQSGEVVRIGDGIHFSSSQLAKLVAETKEAFAGRPFAASEFRDRFGTSRKFAIPLLEYFDSVRLTLRIGDNRVLQSER